MSKTTLGYMLFFSSTPGTYTGGIMVCDEKGFPLEFRYSEPIVPTKLQQILYGNVLEKYIKLDVIAENLIKSVSNALSYLVVQDDLSLEHSFGEGISIFRLSLTNTNQLEKAGKSFKIKKKEYLVQPTEKSMPVRLQFPSSDAYSEEKIENILLDIINVGQLIEISEPFERVQKALELVCQQSVKADSKA